jgi:hypothetical protein
MDPQGHRFYNGHIIISAVPQGKVNLSKERIGDSSNHGGM